MTDMKRVTVAIPDELDQRILDVKRRGNGRDSYSEIVRQILDKGLDVICKAAPEAAARPSA